MDNLIPPNVENDNTGKVEIPVPNQTPTSGLPNNLAAPLVSNTTTGKRMLYGFASSLFLGLGLPVLVSNVFFNGQISAVFGWIVLLSFIIFFILGFKFPSLFEKVAEVGLVAGAPMAGPIAGPAGIRAMRTLDMQKKFPIWLGWYFTLLILINFILLFTRYIKIVPYLIFPGLIIFLYYVNKFSKKN